VRLCGSAAVRLLSLLASLSLRADRRCTSGRAGWGSALRLAVRRNPAWTAGFSGFLSFGFYLALAVGPRSTALLADRRLSPASRRSRLRSEPQPALPRRRVSGWPKTFASI